MKVSRQDLVEVIGERTLHITDSTKLAQNIAAYLVSENHKIDLQSLLRDIMQYRLNKGIVEVVLVSAHELSPDVIQDVRELLSTHLPETKEIIIDTRIDSDVVGGVRIELPRERLDLTVQSKLNTFKRLTSPERN